ncbi:MAG TPA: hypothetical protein VGA69_06435 [Nitriliruptorales bacterium]
MSGAEITWIILAGVLLLPSLALAVVVVRLVRTVEEVTLTIRGVREQTLPLLGGINETVAGVNVELARVDAIMAGVQNITATADSLVGVLHATVSNPMIKAAAFVVGAARGAKKLKG